MDGYEAVRQIEQRSGVAGFPSSPSRPASSKEQRPEILAVGCDDMVAKPFQEHEIFEVMSGVLDLKYTYVSADGPLQAPAREGALTADMHS